MPVPRAALPPSPPPTAAESAPDAYFDLHKFVLELGTNREAALGKRDELIKRLHSAAEKIRQELPTELR